MADAPLLDLDTLIVRPTILIDGVSYQVLHPEELTILDSHRFGVWGREIEALSASEHLTDGELLGERVDQVVKAALVDLPDEVFDKLHGNQKMAVVDVFTGLLLRNKLGVAGAMATAMGVAMEVGQPIGAMPSPGSAASMAGRRITGWLKRLARWFGLS